METKPMTKRIISAVLVICTIVAMLCAMPVVSSAWYEGTTGYYTYTAYPALGRVDIKACSKSIKGDVTIPSYIDGCKVTGIGTGAFKDCTGITSVTMPATLQDVSVDAFAGCTNLKTVNLNYGLTYIYSSAFENTAITSVIIPDTVTYLGSSVFEGCTKLAYVTVGSGVTEIGGYTFNGCTSLSAVTLRGPVSKISYSAFKGCTSLTAAPLGYYLTEIGDQAFYGCTSLTSVAVPNNVKTIGSGAFNGCSRMSTLTLGSSVAEIDTGAFENCTSLTKVTLPNSVKTLGSSVFNGCTALTSATVGSGLKVLSRYTFNGCTSLKSVNMGANVTDIEFSAFTDCKSLASVSLPKKLKTIGDYAFENCSAFTSLALPDTLVSIGSRAFDDCDALTVVSGSPVLKDIGSYAFYGCDNLVKVVLKRCTNIGPSAFSNCPKLAEVWLPDDLALIESFAFYNSPVSHVVYGADSAKWGNILAGDGIDVIINAAKTWNKPAYYDVNYTSWYVEALEYCVNKSYFSGTSAKTFGPKDSLTRAQFVVVLAQVAGADLTPYNYSSFSDVPAGKWYTSAIAWAAANGYVSGIADGVFGRSNGVTREQLILMFYTYAKNNGINVSASSSITHFADYGRVHDWAKQALSWGFAVGLISGTSDTTLDPRGVVTRTQACQMFSQFDRILGR